MSAEDDYGGHKIIKNDWPKWVPTDDGGWRRDWHFEFESPVAVESLAAQLDEPGLAVSVSRTSSASVLDIAVTTHGNPKTDDTFFFAMYRLFKRVEEMFGPIRTIQGQAREMWRPFR
jgi:hypothetical protein